MGKSTLHNLIVIRAEIERLESISKLLGESKSEEETIVARQESEHAFLIFIEPDNLERWTKLLDEADVPFRPFNSEKNPLMTFGLPDNFASYFTEVMAVNRLTFMPATIVETAKKQDCHKTELIKSGLAQGSSWEITLRSDVSPETIEKAKAEAIGEAAKEAAEEMVKAQAKGCTCKAPCVCRYMITYGKPTQAGSNTIAEAGVSQDIKGLSVKVNAGKITTVSANVNWSLWRTCVQKGDAGFDKSKPPVQDEKTITQAGTKFKVHCETFFKTDQVRVVKEYTDDITYTERDTAKEEAKEVMELRGKAIEEAVNKAASEAGKVLLTLDPCSTACSNSQVTMFIAPPEISLSNLLMRPYGAGYEYVIKVIANCRYWVYKRCE